MFIIFQDLIICVLVVILHVMNAKGGKNKQINNNNKIFIKEYYTKYTILED